MGGEVYVCDATSLIDLHRHFPKIFSRKLKKLTRTGRLKVPEGVYRELLRGSDKLRVILKKWQKEHCIVINVSSSSRLQAQLGELERNYGDKIQIGNRTYRGFWKSKAGRQAADSQVVAMAKVHGHTVVSDDTAVRLACSLEDVPCISWTEFARRISLSYAMPSLFDQPS